MEGFQAQFLRGLETTVLVAAISGALGIAVGLAGAAAKLSRFRFLRALADAYTTVVRGVPELLVILLVYFGGTARSARSSAPMSRSARSGPGFSV
jgi:octopine/nopaline transport system permease protein